MEIEKTCIIDIKEIKINICPICLENIKKEKKLKCNHSFCKNCIKTWKHENNTCPICRSVIIDKKKKERIIINENINENCLNRRCQNLKFFLTKQIIFYTYCLGQTILGLILLWLIGTVFWKIILLVLCLLRRCTFSWCIEDTFTIHLSNYGWEWLLGLVSLLLCFRGCVRIFCDDNMNNY
jgi:hypothetical protein